MAPFIHLGSIFKTLPFVELLLTSFTSLSLLSLIFALDLENYLSNRE